MNLLPTPKERLDKLIAKSRAHLYKPIQIAEILFRDRVHRDIDLMQLDTYRRPSTRWRNAVSPRLVGKVPVLNSRYEDQLFDSAVLPPEAIAELGEVNRAGNGLIEVYIYALLKNRFGKLAEIKSILNQTPPKNFNLASFLALFEDTRLRRSIDKVYEIIVYALFETLTRHLNATVTLAIDENQIELLKDFKVFANLVLGVSPEKLAVVQPARLYRVGTTNAADAGLDMWANFGPAIQVKHLTLTPEDVDDILEGMTADQVVVVCKSMEKRLIANLLGQIGLSNRIRGFITEVDLIAWYDRCCTEKYAEVLGKTLLYELGKAFASEFPLSERSEIDAFFGERGYSETALTEVWRIDQALSS
ncbi:MAG: HaeII family restriction endonuclease [Rhizobacter sp.]|nr:HaeII family restriction endonuclease [Chlorobiales bacterium]